MTRAEDLAVLEEELAKIEAEEQSDSSGTYGSPEPEKKDSNLKLFRDMIHSVDSRKIANLSHAELGGTTLGVRHQLEIALYCEAEGLDKLAGYFQQKAEIITSTSMSKQGWLGQLIVTQIKKESKIRDSTPPTKKSWWGGGSKREQMQTTQDVMG